MNDPRRAPPADALVRLCAALSPGGRAAGVRRLPGGLDAAMHALTLAMPSGARRRLVVRRYVERTPGQAAATARRAWQTLAALDKIGVAAPRPVLLDVEGDFFGTPAFVMTRVPGHGLLAPRDRADWTRQFAQALARLHRAPLAGVDLGFLDGPEEHLERLMTWAMRHTDDQAANADSAAVRAALLRWRPRLRRMAPVLTHNDYWAGNTVWLRGRLTAIVDWDGGAVSYPGVDVGYCRMDLSMLDGPNAAATFLDAYEAAAGWRIPQLHFWDLLGASRALPDPERWLPGYHDLGRTEIRPADMRGRLHAFIADALARAG